jgi:DNA-binding transcriptional LysR family regulator
VTEKLVLIASPSALPQHGAMSPAQVAQHSLLSVVSRPNAWSDWFERHRLDHHVMRPGPSFELTSHLIQAVAAGIGIALVPRILVQDEIDNGELVTLFEPMDSGRHYWLAYATRFQNLPSLCVFRDWLMSTPFPDSL